MDKLNELSEQAKFISDWHGDQWASALCQRGDGSKVHVIISEALEEIVISTGSDSNESSWLCDYLELCSPDNVLTIAEAFRALEQRAEAAEAQLAELAKQEPIGWLDDNSARIAANGYLGYISNHQVAGLPGQYVFTRAAPAAEPFADSYDELRAQGIDIMKAKTLQSMERTSNTFDKETWEIVEQALLGMIDGCEVVAKELRTGTLPEKFRVKSNPIEGVS